MRSWITKARREGGLVDSIGGMSQTVFANRNQPTQQLVEADTHHPARRRQDFLLLAVPMALRPLNTAIGQDGEVLKPFGFA